VLRMRRTRGLHCNYPPPDAVQNLEKSYALLSPIIQRGCYLLRLLGSLGGAKGILIGRYAEHLLLSVAFQYLGEPRNAQQFLHAWAQVNELELAASVLRGDV